MSIINPDLEEFDINQLDAIVTAFYNGSGSTQQEAQITLTEFQNNPSSWTKVDQILQYSQNNQTRFIALSILDKLIKTRWKSLPREQQIGIRNFVVGMILSFVRDERTYGNSNGQQLIRKCDLTLVEILKQEWPEEWPEFITELIQSSASNINVCENNLMILKLLYEEIFDFSEGKMTQAKIMKMKKSMSAVCLQIYSHIIDIMNLKVNSNTLKQSALVCLLNYLDWVSSEYVFQSGVLQLLSATYLAEKETRNLSLQCLTTIISIAVPANEQDKNQILQSFENVLTTLGKVIPPATSGLKLTYASSNFQRQQSFQELAKYLTKFLKVYREKLEIDNGNRRSMLLTANEYLVQLSRIDEIEIFKICLDYWHELTSSLFLEIQQFPISDMLPSMELSFEMNGSGAMHPQILKQLPLKKHIYEHICSELRKVIITEKMVRPDEIIIVKDIDSGDVVREAVRDSDMLNLYQCEKETLVYLTYLNFDDTEDIIITELVRQMELLSGYLNGDVENQNGWAWDNLNCLCWSIGSIPSTISEVSENNFIKTVLEKLTSIPDDHILSPNDRALYDSNVMYIVGQYPRFLKNHWDFLLNIMDKLFQCMHDPNEGIQDMACDTFTKIVDRCKYQFVINKPEDKTSDVPLIKNIIDNLKNITSNLGANQLKAFYKACATVVKEERNYTLRCSLLTELMQLPNTAWLSIINQDQSTNTEENYKALTSLLDINIAVCEATGRHFIVQLEPMYAGILQLYKSVSDIILQQMNGDNITISDSTIIRICRNVKRRILNLFKTFVMDLNATDFDRYYDPMLKSFMDIALLDYRQELPAFKDPELLICMNEVVIKSGQRNSQSISSIIENTFLPTLNMLSTDTSDYPDHRIHFYKLLRTINLKGFQVIMTEPIPNFFKLFVDTVCWSFKHHNHEVEETGLQIGVDLIRNVDCLTDYPWQSSFYQTYYLTFVNEILFAITDLDHTSVFAKQALLFRNLLVLVYENRIPVPIIEGNNLPDNFSNTAYLNEYITNLLTNSFSTLTVTQVESFLNALMKNCANVALFTNTVSDFIIQIKEIGGDPTDYLFDEEQEK